MQKTHVVSWNQIYIKKWNEQLINIEHCQYKLEQYSKREHIQGIHPQDIKIINLEDIIYCNKDIQKIGISINKCMIIACHRLGKTTETIVKFANRKDAEHVLFKK